jgi:hypothetical protein
MSSVGTDTGYGAGHYVHPEGRALSELHRVTTYKSAFFIKSNAKSAVSHYTFMFNFVACYSETINKFQE